MFKMWFWVTTRTGFHVLMLKKSISFLILSSAVPLCMKYSVLAHVSLRLLPSVLWLVSAHMPEPEQLTAFQIGSIVYRLPDSFTSTVNIFVNYAKVRYGNAVWRHKVTGQDHVTTTDEPFQEQCFLWQRGALIDVDFDLFNYKKFNVHKNWYNTRKEKKKQTKKKALSKRSPLRQKTCHSRGADTLRCLQDDTYLDVGAHHWVLASSGPFLPSSCPNMRW